MRTRYLGMATAVLGLVLAGTSANTSKSIEVAPPSPVPALSPTVISVTYAAADNSFVFVIGVVDGKMYLPEVNDAGPGKLTFSGPPGTYAIMGMESGKRIQQTVVVEGDDGPDPPVPPPTPGKRSVVIVHETADNTPAFALAVQKLQQYAKEQGHWYRDLDDDATDQNGKPIPWLTDLLAKAKDAKVKEPFIVIGDHSGDGVGKVLKLVAFPESGEAAISILKSMGG